MGSVNGDADSLNTAYVQLKTHRRKHNNSGQNCFRDANITPPVDKHNGIYFALVLAGVGFLLPYNSFIMAADYFSARYPDSTVVFDMSIVYIVVAFCAVLVNNILVETCSLNTRITFGYILSLLTLLFVAFCEIGWEVFSESMSYAVNLSAVAIVAVGCTVQQSSLYGFTSMLPSRYTQAVMAGESAAGFWVSLNRIFTKLLLSDERQNTIIFFLLSIMLVGISCLLYQVIKDTAFVNFYISLCQERSRIVLEPNEDMGLMENGDQDHIRYGVLKIQTSPPPVSTAAGVSQSEDANGFVDEPLNTPPVLQTTTNQTTNKYTSFSFSNPVYDLSNNAYDLSAVGATTNDGRSPTGFETRRSNTKAFKVEDVVIRGASRCGGIKRAISIRWRVAGCVYPYMVTISLAYFVTLCLYPGIETEIVSCRLGSWMPVMLMTVFNLSDLIGKILASIPYEWSRRQLIMVSALRMLLVPLFILCASPRAHPILAAEGYSLILSSLLGITNGMVGSVPMIQAPQRVPQEFREITGNIMTLSYNIGLTGGSLVAYLLHSLLGPQLTNPCPVIPPFKPTDAPQINITTTAFSTLMSILFVPTSTLATTEFSTTTVSATTALINATLFDTDTNFT